MKKLKLTKLSKRELEKSKGGMKVEVDVCLCSCAYVNCGGSSSRDNGTVNSERGLYSPCWGDCC